jgi:endonuclease/exonuclease/phosphatase family metal-dependent hydrolase
MILLGSLQLDAQNIPAIGTDSTIEMANWNIEWLGNTGNGPSNEKTQLSNAAVVINKAKLDLWGLCEISSQAAWDSLLARCPEYGGVISTWSQEQKTALMYNKSIFRVLYQKHPLGVYELEFAGGRLPLEVGLEMDMGTWKDTVYAFVIHLKANTGNNTQKADAWDRRKRSSEALKEYLDAWGKWKKTMVLGDWNDDVDKSIFSNYATPFSAFLGDTSRYIFTSRNLSLTGQTSTTSYVDMIDHQCASKRLANSMVGTSASVFKLQAYITAYSSTTSDHYPVYTLFKFQKPAEQQNGIQEMEAMYPDFYWDGNAFVFADGIIREYKVFDLLGRNIEQVKSGNYYVLQFSDNGGVYRVKTFIYNE